MWRIGKLGCVLEHNCLDESDEPPNNELLIYSESGVLIAYHGGLQDASLCMDWDWDVLGELCLVLERPT